MAVIRLQSKDDERLWPYLNTPDRELAAQSDLFIAEGEHLVRRMLASDCAAHSLLVSLRRVDEIASAVPADVPLFTTDDETINRILGYRFHAGIMGCAHRLPNRVLSDVMGELAGADGSAEGRRCVVVICPEIHNSENLGSIIRLCAAFNVGVLIVGERCCDPWWRRCVRVSMGSVMYLPIVRSANLAHDLIALKEQWGVSLIATVVGDSATEELTPTTVGAERLGLMVGSESQGLAGHWVHPCERRITIPMHRNTDSLNVSLATGIFLWHFTQSGAEPGPTVSHHG